MLRNIKGIWLHLAAYGSQSSDVNICSIHFVGELTTVGSRGSAVPQNNISDLALTSPHSKLGLLESIALKSIAAMSCTEVSSSVLLKNWHHPEKNLSRHL